MKKSMARRLISTAFWMTVTGVGTLHFYDAFVNHDKIQYLKVPVRSRRIPKELHGYRLGFVTDVHQTSEKKLQRLVENLNKQKLDALLLGGDFARDRRTSWNQLKMLSQVKTKDGIYGVEGNHDTPEDLAAGMKLYGMTLLNNEGVHLQQGLYLAGVQEVQYRSPDIPKGTKGRTPSDFVILLSHNPDLTMKQDTSEIDLTICGHIHGGEWSLFGAFAPVLLFPFTPKYGISEYNQRFRTGWCRSRDGTPVYVSNGVGRHLPFRVYTPPQVITFVLEHPERKE